MSPIDNAHEGQPAPQREGRPTADGPETRPSSPAHETDVRRGQRVAGSTWVALVLGALILILLLIFVVQNGESADFAYLGLTFSLPLGVAMLFAAIAGMLVMALFGSVQFFRLGRRIRRLDGERGTIKRST